MRATRNIGTPEVNGVHCLDWQGALNSRGYPVTRWNGQCVLVTRLVLSTRRYFRRKEFALHECDRPCCIEPRHLEHGKQAKNMRDWHRRRSSPHPTTFLRD